MTPKPFYLTPTLIKCVECGEMAKRGPRASLCYPCRKRRHQKRSALSVKARRKADPEYNAKYRAKYNELARIAKRRNWPVPCAMCSTPIECLRGRKRTDAICRRCSREHRAVTYIERQKRAA